MSGDGSGARSLVVPGTIFSPLTFTRTQASAASSSYFGVNGAAFTAAADTPRYNGEAQRLLIEGARTNNVRNPRCEGVVLGVLGSGGALPTRWSHTSGGLTCTVLAFGRQNGVDYVRLRFAGTATSTFGRVDFEPNNGVAALPSQAWANSMFVALIEAPAPANILRHAMLGLTSGGAVVAGNNFGATITATSAFTRHVQLQSLTSAATIANVIYGFNYGMTVGVAYDFTVDIGWPQMELGAFASMPILPAVGTPAAAARGPDLITAPLGSLGLPAGGAGTYLFSGVIGQAAPSAANQVIFCIDDGTASNQYLLRNSAGGTVFTLIRSTAGALASSNSGAALTPGVVFRFGVAISAEGRAALSIDGGPVATVVGGPTGGLTTLRLGNNSVGAPMFGEASHFRILPYVASDNELQQLVMELPA
jgi:hypothetical protein